MGEVQSVVFQGPKLINHWFKLRTGLCRKPAKRKRQEESDLLNDGNRKSARVKSFLEAWSLRGKSNSLLFMWKTEEWLSLVGVCSSGK